MESITCTVVIILTMYNREEVYRVFEVYTRIVYWTADLAKDRNRRLGNTYKEYVVVILRGLVSNF